MRGTYRKSGLIEAVMTSRSVTLSGLVRTPNGVQSGRVTGVITHFKKVDVSKAEVTIGRRVMIVQVIAHRQ